ncbi:AraC family transcriptional regulator [Oleomonas cavernae]|nr:AraC family transcriptional regulator [Oleomonas cavernae]
MTLPNWLKAAALCGFDVTPLFAQAGIDIDLIHLESATVRPSQIIQVMTAAVALAKRGHFPFALGETFAFEYMPDIEVFVTTSPTLRQALPVFDLVRAFINPMLAVDLREDGAVARLILRSDHPTEATPYFAESLFAAILKFARRLLDQQHPFHRLCLTYPAPAHAAKYRAFFKLPVAFEQRENAIEFDRDLLDRPLRGGVPVLHRQAEYRIERRMAHRPRYSGVTAAVEATLRAKPALLGGGLAATAQAMAWPSRSLQRRLAEEGENFAALQARVRQQLAMAYLDDDRGDIEALSDYLGFSDRRSFTRAFVRWTGQTPRAFRAKGRTER